MFSAGGHPVFTDSPFQISSRETVQKVCTNSSRGDSPSTSLPCNHFKFLSPDTSQVKELTSILYGIICGQAMLVIPYKYIKAQSGPYGFPSDQNITKSFQQLVVNIGSVSSLFFDCSKYRNIVNVFEKEVIVKKKGVRNEMAQFGPKRFSRKRSVVTM
ncbi:uncharacterized protein LOC111325482 isoform X2 [Stylophora pistillata]|uniref:uncharacterized protein LOC111325482 isoform X2 n=1 Tax=Stylophora pistillata TaxID=50429 RepID=UPI000C043F90|nr:uncharacterized protein LOC111325482 isoform X2 [Stylophora pistillata]